MDSVVACHTGGPGSIPAMSKCSLGYKVVGKNGASHNNWRDLASPCSYKIIIIIIIIINFSVSMPVIILVYIIKAHRLLVEASVI